jgi:hypothetical protein
MTRPAVRLMNVSAALVLRLFRAPLRASPPRTRPKS